MPAPSRSGRPAGARPATPARAPRVADQPGQPGHGTRRPLVGRRGPTPQAQLVAVVAAHLVGHQAQQHDPGRHLARSSSTRRAASGRARPSPRADSPAARYQARSLRSPCSVSAVTTSAGAHPTLGGERGDELVGEVLADEHQRVELDDRVVEGLLDAAARVAARSHRPAGRRRPPARRWAWRPDGPKRARTSPAGSAARSPRRARPMRANSPTSSAVDLADDVQPRHRQRGEEGRAGPGGGTISGHRPARRARDRRRRSARRRCPMPSPVLDGPASRRTAATICSARRSSPPKYARRAAGAEAQPARLDDLEAGANRPTARTTGSNARASRSGSWSSSTTSGQHCWAWRRRWPIDHPFGRRRRGAGDDPVGVEHDRRHVRRRPGGDDRPVGAPHGDHPAIDAEAAAGPSPASARDGVRGRSPV